MKGGGGGGKRKLYRGKFIAFSIFVAMKYATVAIEFIIDLGAVASQPFFQSGTEYEFQYQEQLIIYTFLPDYKNKHKEGLK